MTDEAKRLEALKSYQIMDSDPEPEFDSLLDLVADICEVPVAYISFMDGERQWYKSKRGLDIDEFPQEGTFCETTLMQNDPLIVPNLTEDERFSQSPFVTDDPKFRFYAGAPLTHPDGHNVGTVCLVDIKPRELTDLQKNTLKTVSKQIIAQLELQKKNRDLMQIANDLKQHQDSLVQTEKLASLGRMAGGIAHELNNPLQVLNNYMELVSVRARKIDHKEEFADIVKNSKNTIFRMARIIQTMLSFVKSRRNSTIEEVTLLVLIDDTLMLLSERLANYGGTFKTQWDIDNQLTVSCNPVEVSQVLINLISNAIDASRSNESPQVDLIIQQDNKELIFTVRDNGEGIPDELLSKVKDPFFTTKEGGKGTGLGLFIGHQVAERMGGKLDYNRDSNFTLFSLTIPFKK